VSHPTDAFARDHFAGQTVLLTGAAGGMGLAASRAFARHGATVLLADRDGDAARKAAADIVAQDGKAVATTLDVASFDSIIAAFDLADRTLGKLDHVVTCAAIITAVKALDQTWAHWQKVLDINLVGTFFVVQKALARMIARGSGNIVCVASDAGVRGGGGLIADAAYAASKAGVQSLVKSLAREMAGKGIRINALNPGPADTPMHAGISRDLKARIAEGLPMKRMGTPADMAGAVLFLCSSASGFVYGAGLDCDGGSMFR
jgi:3-oxoacyl-[acyl-carrier protein] reductase